MMSIWRRAADGNSTRPGANNYLHQSTQREFPHRRTLIPSSSPRVQASGMGGVVKLMMSIGKMPLVAWTLCSLAAASSVRRIIVVARPDRVDEFGNAPYASELDAIVVPGGTRRQDSVANGVDAATGSVVLIHDGARPLVTPDLIDRVAAGAWENGAAVPIVALPESMREVVDGGIVRIVDRIGLYRSQTPAHASSSSSKLTPHKIHEARRRSSTRRSWRRALEPA